MDPEEVTDPVETIPEPEPVAVKKAVIPEETMQCMQKLWRVYDMKKTGVISIQKLQSMLAALDFHLNSKELAIVSKQVDPNHTGSFGFAELTTVMEDRLKEVDTYMDFVEQF